MRDQDITHKIATGMTLIIRASDIFVNYTWRRMMDKTRLEWRADRSRKDVENG